jgi:hypothetical protein
MREREEENMHAHYYSSRDRSREREMKAVSSLYPPTLGHIDRYKERDGHFIGCKQVG